MVVGVRIGSCGISLCVSNAGTAGSIRLVVGAAISLIGALGVFEIRDGAGFLISWEIMSSAVP